MQKKQKQELMRAAVSLDAGRDNCWTAAQLYDKTHAINRQSTVELSRTQRSIGAGRLLGYIKLYQDDPLAKMTDDTARFQLTRWGRAWFCLMVGVPWVS